jgi:hypothetical protein
VFLNVKHLIRKILRESAQIPDDAPEWVKRFHKLPKEDRIQDIENRKDKIEKLMPNIINFFEDRFGDELEKIVINQKKVHYGNELYSTEKLVINFYFYEPSQMFPRAKYYNEVVRDLINFFNIDITYYGMPLDIEIHVKKR